MIGEKPTIAELDQILDGNGKGAIEIGPDGSLVTSEFRQELESLINRHSKENESNTPDFILAKYLITSLMAFDNATKERDRWYGKEQRPGAADQLPTTGPAK